MERRWRNIRPPLSGSKPKNCHWRPVWHFTVELVAMNQSQPSKLQERVIQAAEAVLKSDGSVGPLELIQALGFLPTPHVEAWRKGLPDFSSLQKYMQVGEAKLEKCLEFFEAWVKERRLVPVQATYQRRTHDGVKELTITAEGNPGLERFYRTHFAPGDLPASKVTRLTAKLNRVPDLVVFETVSETAKCNECSQDLPKGSYLFREEGESLCLACADLDYLVFLPAGDTALTRRAKKHSPLSAVVVRFNRRRNRYDRQGLLVSDNALARAEAECTADAPERAEARARAAVARVGQDSQFIEALTAAIRIQYPGCPEAEAKEIAEHAGLRGSGRVGRSAAGRELDPAAVDLAVIAHIRHVHTPYDTLLMKGVERMAARQQVRDKIDGVIQKWR